MIAYIWIGIEPWYAVLLGLGLLFVVLARAIVVYLFERGIADFIADVLGVWGREGHDAFKTSAQEVPDHLHAVG